MNILISFALLLFISCGGGSGGGSGVQSSNISNNNITNSPYGMGSGFENLDKFKSAVSNNQWGQSKIFASYNNYEFHYIKPGEGCTKIGSGFFQINFCSGGQGITPAWTSIEKKGIVTNPLISLSRIKDIVARAVLYNPNIAINPTTPYAYFDSTQWTIVLGAETFSFNPNFPLGANPLYYKNTSTSKEYSMYNYSYSWIQ